MMLHHLTIPLAAAAVVAVALRPRAWGPVIAACALAAAALALAPDASVVRDAASAVAPLAVPVRADQGLWMRFPKGLAAGLKPGDELAAEAATGLTVDSALDFLAVCHA